MHHPILNLKTDDCRHAAYVAQPSPLGNPYAIGPDGDRETVIEKYRTWLEARIAERDPVVCTALLGIHPGQPLACHCAPQARHAEVIAHVINMGIQQQLASPAREKTFRYASIGSGSTLAPVLQAMQKIAEHLHDGGSSRASAAAVHSLR